MRLLSKLVVAGMACGLMVGGTSPAMAASGTAWSTDAGDRGASTHFDDGGGDIVKVCDEDNDGMRAVGWISVRQADGSWDRKSKVEAAGGNGTCTTVNFDVKRERAKVRIVACRQNGQAGNPRDCGSRVVSGS